jgi:hypothetical protein
MEIAIAWPGGYLAYDPELPRIVQGVAFCRALGHELDYATMRLKRDFRVVKRENRRGLDMIAARLRRAGVPVGWDALSSNHGTAAGAQPGFNGISSLLTSFGESPRVCIGSGSTLSRGYLSHLAKSQTSVFPKPALEVYDLLATLSCRRGCAEIWRQRQKPSAGSAAVLSQATFRAIALD